MNRFLVLIFLLNFAVHSISAEVEWQEELFDYMFSKTDGYLPPPPATPSSRESYSFNQQLPKVNVITGEYCEEECDLIVAGIEPLSYRRFYGHQGYKDEGYGHWRINPECLFLFNFETSKYPKYGATGSDNGSFALYEQGQGKVYSFDAQKNKSFTNGGAFTGQDHPLNTHITYRRVQKKRDDFCHWEGEIVDGNGRQRFFKSDYKLWPTGNNKHTACAGSIFIPPYQAPIIEERRPNGNVIRYSYINYNGPSDDQRDYGPEYYILRSISAYSAAGVHLGSMNIDYQWKKDKNERTRVREIHVSGSDGRRTNLFHTIREVRAEKVKRKFHGNGWTFKIIPAIYDTVLDHVNASWKPNQYYQYRWESHKTYFNAPFLFQACQDEGRCLATSYDLSSKKVVAQSAPVGPNNQMAPIARYEYHNDHTIVYDGENNKTIYRFNGDKRITAVEKYQGNNLYSTENSAWDSQTGNLLNKTLEDGTGTLFYKVEYAYDGNQNVIEEKTCDDVITRTFSTDGFNLLLTESDRPGKLIQYTYIPNTNLPASEIVYNNGRVCKRTLHFYDDQIGSALIKTVIDDGQNKHPSFCRIIEITLKRGFPCVGLPEQIKEKTLDTYGNEILLKRVGYTYHPSGKVAQEDHYDANDRYCYSIINTYDEKERLIATTDALGNTTTFAYDSNFNLIEQRGPRPDTRKEWVYDQANRPIEEKEWETAGTILITKKKYDKASRVIATIDACGFETQYEYDSLDRVIAIHHPNGACERKEYDVLGNVIQEIDANGYTTNREYNFRGQQTAIYRPDGSEEHFVYHPNGGTLTSLTDSQGTKTVYFYDVFDHLIRTETYSREGEFLKATMATYSSFQKLSETDGEGVTTYYSYDHAGRKIREEKNGKEIFYFYDALGNLSRTQVGDALYEEEFDLKGRVIEKRTTDLAHNVVEQEKYVYDEAGNLIYGINSKGATETQYNAQGFPIFKTDALGNTTRYSYCYNNGFIKAEIDPLGVQTVHVHDARGNTVQTYKTNALGEEIQKVERLFDGNHNLIQEKHFVFANAQPIKTVVHSWVYGPCNRLEKLIEAGQKETHYFYDATGKLAQIIKPDRTALQSDYDDLSRLSHFASYTYTYDRNDRVLSVYDTTSNTQTTRAYDPLGNLVQEVLGNGLALSSFYDIHGRRTCSLFPDGTTADYSYYANRLYQISRNGLKCTYAERDLEGNLSKIELPGATLSIERDPLSRWKRYASPFYSAVFGYDSVGNLSSYQYTDPLGIKKCSYTYDALKQLTSENEHSYRHDSLYNRLAKDESPYMVNDLCEVVHDGSTTYEYDPNGNLLFDGTRHFKYDILDRLIGIQQGSNQTLYSYDPFNRRLSKTLLEEGKKVKKELYFYDGDNEIGCMDEEGNIEELRILGEGLGAEIGASVFLELHGKSYIPIHDHRGCTVVLMDTDQKPVETYRYTSYGEQLTGGKLSPWRFSSKRVDPETDYVFFGRRYYSPNLGRWITPDPQGFEDGPNLYAYLHNCPLNSFDLYGLYDWRSSWDSFCGYFGGFCGGVRDFGFGMYNASAQMGEWMHADFQYEYFNDASFFNEKSQRSLDDWRGTGQFAKAAYQDPMLFANATGEAFIPGIMQVYREPTNPDAWGRATFDVALLALPIGKLGQASKAAGRARKFAGKASSAFGMAEIFSVNEGAQLSTNGLKLAKQLASDAQMAESGKTIIQSSLLSEAGRLSQQYGGRPSDWVKKTSSSFAKSGTQFETHWYENTSTGKCVEYKTKFKN